MVSPRALAGHVVTFAGRLVSMSRKQASHLVARAGGVVEPEVTGRTTLLVIGAEAGVSGGAAAAHLPADLETARRARAADEVNAREAGRIRMMTEEELCELLGRVTPEALRKQFVAWRAVSGRFDAIGDDHLRYLEKWGLLRSVVRTPSETYYGFADVAVIKQANAALATGASFRAVVRSLTAERDGQLTLDFRTDALTATSPSNVVALAARSTQIVGDARRARLDRDVPLSPAEARFLEGEQLEAGDPGDIESAMAAYRDAITLDPILAPAMVNLGNLHYALDQFAEAQALYVHAVLVDPACFEAHFNLGNVHHDLGRFEQAMLCYEEALRLSPDFPDAHFYLAVALEKMGRSEEARAHWLTYRALAPDGEWAELAGEFIE
jgi:tetratricopeptide (TPR) repeat protein